MRLIKYSGLFLLLGLLAPADSQAVDTGQPAPTFTLTSPDGKKVSLDDYKDKVVVLEWFNDGCPFVQKHYKAGDMQALQKEFGEKGVVWLNINSTSADHRDFRDSAKTKELVKNWKIDASTFLIDSSGEVGKLYEAKTTPHMFVIDKGKLVYQGAIDDAADTDSDPKKAKNYVRTALNDVLSAKPVETTSTKPYGCSIKYAK